MINNIKSFKITDDIVRSWVDVYILSSDGDKHTRFANALNISRDDAKYVCYKTMWVTPFLRRSIFMDKLLAFETILDKAKKVATLDDLISWLESEVERSEKSLDRATAKVGL